MFLSNICKIIRLMFINTSVTMHAILLYKVNLLLYMYPIAWLNGVNILAKIHNAVIFTLYIRDWTTSYSSSVK